MANMVIELQADFNIEDNIVESDLNLNEMSVSSDIEENFIIKHLDGVDDYTNLKNLPKINNTTLIDNYDEIDPTVPQWAKQQSKPQYTAEEVGAVGESNVVSLSKIDLMFLRNFGI